MRLLTSMILLALVAAVSQAQQPSKKTATPDTSRGDAMIADYFRKETARLAEHSLAAIRTREDWLARRDEYRRQLREMLGLDPLPARTPLEPVITGTVEHDEFVVENLHFQSRPGLYVTANLYRPRELKGPAPAILYVCGHSRVREGDVSLGNKTYYQHHGAWFARNGYVCLTLDTLQLGEIEGVHHGTYNLGQWWWNARGYTPAGVEAWNGIRALDYLETHPEVDRERMGVTGRSGGGATSWWVAALDERVRAAVPVAGITDIENHVVDGTVEGHCDCMFLLNTYQWDYSQVAALVAPRPLLISNTDKDPIFPLEGVVRIHNQVRRVYRLLDADKNLGLQITEGPHEDTQELHIHAFRWFNRFLKNDAGSQVEKPALKFIRPAELRVFDRLPGDEVNTSIQRQFTQAAPAPELPKDAAQWRSQRDAWLDALRDRVFRGWPQEAPPVNPKPVFAAENEGVRLAAYDFESQPGIPLRLFVAWRAGLKPGELDLVVLNALDEPGWTNWLAQMRQGFAEALGNDSLPPADEAAFTRTQKMFATFRWGMAWIAPRGIGPTAWNPDERKQVQNRRRFQLLGQTLDGMRVWDVRRAAQALRALDGLADRPLWLQGEDTMAGIVLYASLFEPDVARLDLWRPAPSHEAGPDFLNVLRFLDIPAALAMAAERSKVRLYDADASRLTFARDIGERLGWPRENLQFREPRDTGGGDR